MFHRHRSQVLVVGAGPVGLFTALLLTERGITVQIIDKQRRTGTHSYALALHPRSLKLLEPSGLTETLLGHGQRVEGIGFYEKGRRCGELPLSALESDYPFALVLPQSTFEFELEKRLQQSKVQVLWDHRLEDLEQGDDGVVANVARLDQVASGYPIARLEWMSVGGFRARSEFVVGADGYHSTLRKQLGIDFAIHGKEEGYAVYEFELEDHPSNELRIAFDGEWTSVLWPMSAQRFRWSFQLSNEGEYDGSMAGINRLIAARAPWFPKLQAEPKWSSLVRFDRRLATAAGRGRVWLAGDAIHLTRPTGVQSMNAGLVDAHELVELLAAMLKDSSMPNLVDSYQRQRLRELGTLFCVEKEIESGEETAEWARSHRAQILSALPATGRDLGVLLSKLGLRCGEHAPARSGD